MMRVRASFSALLVMALATPAAAAADPVARTDALVNALKAVKAKPKGSAEPLSDADRKANTAAFLTLDAFFDYDRITNEAIAPHKEAFAPADRKKFLVSFREVIRLVAYPDAGRALGKAKIELKAGQVHPDEKQADVKMTIRFEGEDADSTITFHWVAVGGTWKVYDVDFDNESLMKAYQNQFGRILQKEKVEGLMKKLDGKLDDKRKENVVTP